jgi:hypothetical protein
MCKFQTMGSSVVCALCHTTSFTSNEGISILTARTTGKRYLNEKDRWAWFDRDRNEWAPCTNTSLESGSPCLCQQIMPAIYEHTTQHTNLIQKDQPKSVIAPYHDECTKCKGHGVMLLEYIVVYGCSYPRMNLQFFIPVRLLLASLTQGINHNSTSVGCNLGM